jgi:hypothetical protein
MKIKWAIVVMLCCFFSAPVLAQQLTKKEVKAAAALQKQKEIEALIESRNFVFDAEKAIPLGYRFILLDHNSYFVNFTAEKATAELPFFGRAFSAPYGGDGGIKFEGKPENVQVEKKKKSYIIKATVKGKDDVFNLLFSVFFNGSTSLSISSNNRASISYDGVIRAQKKLEDKK